MPDADPTSESPRRRDRPTPSHMPHIRPPPRRPQPPPAPTGCGDARSRTGRPGGPCSRAPPALPGPRSSPADHADFVQPAQFYGAARPRDRLVECRSLGQLVQVGLTHLSCHRHREQGLDHELDALLIGDQKAAQPFSHCCQGRSRNPDCLVQRVDKRTVRSDRKVATHFGVAPHGDPEHVTRAQHRIPQDPRLGRSGRDGNQEQSGNDPPGAEARPTFHFFTRHHRPPCCERGNSVAKTVLARMRERCCCGAATDGRGCRASLEAWHMPPVTRERRPAGVLNALSKAAFACLWCFVFVLPWDVYAELPVVGSIPRLVGIVASTVGVLYICARRRVRPLSWFHALTLLFVLWAAVSTLWSIDTEATRTRLLTYVQLAVLVWLIWEIAWSPQRTRALLGAYVLGVAVASVATIRDYLSGEHAAGYAGRFYALSINPN